MMNIAELIKEAHDNAVERGFYSDDKDYCQYCKDYDNCDSEYREPAGTCDLFVTPNRNIGELLMLIVSELGEALEAHRCGRFADWKLYNRDVSDHTCIDKSKRQFQKARIVSFLDHIKSTFEDEIADVFIRLFDLCGYLDLKIESRKILHSINWDTDNIATQLKRIVKYIVNINENKVDIIDVTVGYELILSFCNLHNIPIEKHIKAKMAYNRTRPHKHNKEY